MKILFVMIREENIDPLNIQLLSALAKEEGHETFLNVLEHGDLDRDLRSIRPDIIAYSAKTGESNTFFKVNREVRSAWGDRLVSIMGGPHPTFNYQRMRLEGEELRPKVNGDGKRREILPVEETRLDYMAVGEADQSWPALLRALSKNESPDVIPGMVTRTNRKADGTIQLGERTNFLDDLPYLDRDIVYDKTQLRFFGMRTHIASRGCPYPCTYCFNARFNQMYKGKGKTINRYSVDRLLAELSDLVRRYPTQFVKFNDDIFVFRADDWLLEFAEKYPKAVGRPFHCLTRCDLVRRSPEIVDVLKAAGLHSIYMSIESGSDFIRKHVMKRGMSEEDIRFAFDYCRKRGVHTFSNTILAVPSPLIPAADDPEFGLKAAELLTHLEEHFRIPTEEMRASLSGQRAASPRVREEVTEKLRALGLRHTDLDYELESLDINVTCRVSAGEFATLYPFPGAPITQYVIDTGAFDGDFEKLNESFQSGSPFSCFSEQEKMEQLNVSYLGPVLLVFPRLRNFAVQHLVRRPWTKLYFLMYFFVRAFLMGRRIYPLHYSAGQLLARVRASFAREVAKRFPERARKRKKFLLAPASNMLGGPWKG
ncbi:MAG: B12-binding domain-containing radical SAM protein [Acidithiobacillales bacterium]